MRNRIVVVFALLFLPLVISAQGNNDSVAKPKPVDTTFMRPRIYAYAEGFGPGRYYSMNGEFLVLPLKKNAQGLYLRAGTQWLPDLTARYTLSFLGGVNFESGKKNWSRDLGIGVTSWIDHYNWQLTDSLTTTAVGPGKESTLLWGPYLSLGVRYRWDKEIFCGFEFTPMGLKGKDGWDILPAVGVCFGFMIGTR